MEIKSPFDLNSATVHANETRLGAENPVIGTFFPTLEGDASPDDLD